MHFHNDQLIGLYSRTALSLYVVFYFIYNIVIKKRRKQLIAIFKSLVLLVFLITSFSCKKDDTAQQTQNYELTSDPFPAVWAYPDGVSLPYRDDDNQITNDIASIGVVTYHPEGISMVRFYVNGVGTASVTEETLNPETGEYEFVFQLNPNNLPSDGEYTITAIAYSNNDEASELPDLKIQKDTQAHKVLYVGGDGGYDTINAACQASESGDIIKIRNGTYYLPSNDSYRFTKYVTIMPDDSASVSIIPKTDDMLRSDFLKFKGISFDCTATNTTGVISSGHNHYWIDGCTVQGFGRNEPSNDWAVLRFYNWCEWITVENTEILDAGSGTVFFARNVIFRNNHVHDVTSDGVSYDGEFILITGNEIHDNHALGTQHSDFVQSNYIGNIIIIRNNKCYDGDHQGNKWGGWHDGRDQQYINIALVNNQFALGQDVAVNMRLESAVNGMRFNNILVEYNTVWRGTNPLRIDPNVDATDLIYRNNIFGPNATHFETTSGITREHNWYFTTPTVGSIGLHSFIEDPEFNNAESFDFSLQSFSPVKGAGYSTSGIKYDIDWNPRNITEPSIGCYE